MLVEGVAYTEYAIITNYDSSTYSITVFDADSDPGSDGILSIYNMTIVGTIEGTSVSETATFYLNVVTENVCSSVTFT